MPRPAPAQTATALPAPGPAPSDPARPGRTPEGAAAAAPTPRGAAPRPLAGASLPDVETWLFDMDNTLYPAAANLFAQIDRRMEAYVGRLLGLGRNEARAVQKRYFHEHGTTLRGLMLSHGVDPHDFLAFVHDIDVSVLEPDPALAEALGRLPGRRIVFTNGDLPYAERVLDRLGIRDRFDAIFDIHAMAYHPKPDPRAYAALCRAHAVAPERALFVEDMAHNLRPAKELGMTTVWVNNGSERGSHGACASFIDHEIADLSAWLAELTR